MENVTCHGSGNIKPKQRLKKDRNLTSEVPEWRLCSMVHREEQAMVEMLNLDWLRK